MKRKIALFSLFILGLSAGFLVFINFFGHYPLELLIRRVTRTNVTSTDTEFQFESKIPGVTIDSSTTNTALLSILLQKLDLYPFKEKPLLTIDHTNPYRKFSPFQVIVTFYPLTTSLAKENIILSVNGINNAPSIIYAIAEVNTDGSKVSVPVYVDIVALENTTISKDLALTRLALSSIFFNFQEPPISKLGNPLQVFDEKIGDLTIPLFQIQKDRKLNFLQSLSFFFNLLPKAFAVCRGTVTCGTETTVGSCTGPYAGRPCDPLYPCPPGSTCNQATSCVANGGPQSCTPQNVNQCSPYECSSCVISSNCSVAQPVCGGNCAVYGNPTCPSGTTSQNDILCTGTGIRCCGGGPGPTAAPTSPVCNNNGICGAGENTANCSNDCPAPTAAPTSPPGCNCNNWSPPGACNSGGCGDGYRPQTRTCNPANCNNQTQCIYDAVCVAPAPTSNNPPPAPVVDLKINGQDTVSGVIYNSTIGPITWTTSNANACNATATVATGGWLGARAVGNQSQAAVGPFTSTRTLTLTCTGPGGTSSDSVVVQVNPLFPIPSVDLRINGSGGPLYVTLGDTVAADWTVSNATSCTGQSFAGPTTNWDGNRNATTGTHSQSNMGPISFARWLRLTCTGPGGSNFDQVYVGVTAVVNEVTTDLKINGSDGPIFIQPGQTVSADWTVTNATGACTASATVATTGWVGAKNQLGGSQAGIGPINSARTLSLVCPGSAATSNTDSVVINMAPTPTPTIAPFPVVDLKANGQDSLVVIPNSLITMNWDTVNANSCTAQGSVATGGWVGIKAPGAGQSQANVGPIATSRTLSLSCQNISGISSTDNVAITVATPTMTPAANQCTAPPPRDPPVTDCAANIADTVNITWQWEPVPIANQYEIRIVNNLGALIITSGIRPAAFFNCASGMCTFVTNLLRGTYRSIIQSSSSTNICLPSNGSFSNFITVPLCANVNPPTVTLLINGSGGPVSVPINSTVNATWTSTDASVCTASASVATAGWSGSKTLSGSQIGIGPVGTARTFTLTCQGPNGTTVDTVQVNPSAAAGGQCATPEPEDPPTAACVSPPGNTGSITWAWDAVPGANQYRVSIRDTNGNVFQAATLRNAASYGATCAGGGVCTHTTNNHVLGTSYFSRIEALGAACTMSEAADSPPFALSQCPATLNARALRVSLADADDCSAIGSGTGINASFNINPNVAPGAQNSTGNAVTWNNAPPATYTLSSTAGAGYVLQSACIARNAAAPILGGLSQAAASNENLSWNLLYTLGTPWARGQDGEMIMCTDVASTIPNTTSFVVNNAGNSPGIVSYGSSYDFDGSGGGASNVSSTDWLARESVPSICTTNWYQYFANKMDLSGLPLQGFTNPVSLATFVNPITRMNGNVTLQGGTINNRSVTVFVNGNVTLNGNIALTGNSFFAVVASGNITVASGVGTTVAGSAPSIQGLYIAGGNFITGQSTAAATARLVVKGTVIAGGFTLQRDLDAFNANQTTPAEEFIYDPQMLITMPDSFKDLRIKWEEVAP